MRAGPCQATPLPTLPTRLPSRSAPRPSADGGPRDEVRLSEKEPAAATHAPITQKEPAPAAATLRVIAPALDLEEETTVPHFMGDPRWVSGLEGLDSKAPAGIVRTISDYVLRLPCITEGLDQAYSPNHPKGMTTRVHIDKQLQMLNHYVGSEMAAVEALGRGDYEALHEMVANEELPDFLRVSKQDLEELLEPLRQDLSPSDWKVLTIVAGFHDLGKIDPEWAQQSGMDLTGVEWIAHDYDSETILRNNAVILQGFDLAPQEKDKVLLLSRLHSLPGQFFFGEGNVSAYNPLFRMAGEESSESVLNLARIHGALDVMSALNQKFVRPIVDSHQKLRTFISEAYENNTPLGMKFRQTSVKDLEEASDGGGTTFLHVANRYGVGPVAMHRLRRLTSPKLKPDDFEQAFNRLDPEIIYEFHEATDREQTWFGTYVANAFGGGLLKALKVDTEDEMAPASEIIQAMVKVVACAARLHRIQEQSYGRQEEWALGALAPSLEVIAGGERALEILRQTQEIRTVQQGVELLNGRSRGLSLRAGRTGVEIGFS